MNDPNFISHLLEMLAPLGGVTAKRMFGGHGFFREGLMFGLVADGVFFLKADAENAGEFDALDLPPFTYTKATGEVYAMSYRQCPEDALENSAAMTRWAESAFAAAQRNAKPKKSKKPNRKLP